MAGRLSLWKLYTIAFMNDQIRHTEGGSPAAEAVRTGCGGARSTRAIVLSWAAVAVWAVFIFCMSANTGTSLEHGGSVVSQIFQWLKSLQAQALGPGVDVVNPAAHFCEYAVFGALLANAWRFLAPLGHGGVQTDCCSANRADARTRAPGVRGCVSCACSRGSRSSVRVSWRAVLLAVACASLYGVTDELHQYFVPGRACDPADWLVDTCGAVLGAMLLKALASFFVARTKKRA